MPSCRCYLSEPDTRLASSGNQFLSRGSIGCNQETSSKGISKRMLPMSMVITSRARSTFLTVHSFCKVGTHTVLPLRSSTEEAHPPPVN